MAQARMRTAKPPMTRQHATHALNANKLSTVETRELLKAYPPPDWMGDKAKMLWAQAIRSYNPGQFKRYNLPMLEQWVLVIQNINRLTRRLGHTSFLTKPETVIDDNGEIDSVTKITKEFVLYRSLILLATRLELSLHMCPRPYVLMSSAESETLDEGIREDDPASFARGRPANRVELLGGKKMMVN